MNDITIKKIHPKALAAIQEAKFNFKPFDWYIMRKSSSDSFRVIQIIDIEYDAKYKLTRIKFKRSINWEATEFEECSYSLSDCGYFTFEFLPDGLKSFKLWRQESLDLIAGKRTLEQYKDGNKETINEEKALVSKGSKEMLISLQKGLEEKRNKAAMLAVFVGYELARRREELEKVREGMLELKAEFIKKIEKIERVITSIELYLGINEELHHFRQGKTASQDEPICFRQMMLYMDEEMGLWEHGGADYNYIDKFDEWLVENDNFGKLVPESKCVVVFRPRRRSKFYTEDAFVNARANIPNLAKTYILIRNGDNLYRIFTENLFVAQRLFPLKKEFAQILSDLSKVEKDYGADSGLAERKKDEVDDILYSYKKQAILLQGLIDRTQVFHPLVKPDLSIFRLHENPSAVKFIYDDEVTLPTGRLPFWKWHENINRSIKDGSRILITGHYNDKGYVNNADFANRLYYRVREYNAPDPPNAGIYSVESFPVKRQLTLCETQFKIIKPKWDKEQHEYKLIRRQAKGFSKGYNGWHEPDIAMEPLSKEEDKIIIESIRYELTIMHNPGGSTTHGWNDYQDHERKNRIRFRIHANDDWLLNYDQISLADIDFYLESRVDRANYLGMMPVLVKLKEIRLKEMASESEFVKLIVNRNLKKLKLLSASDIESRIKECVAWWKYKNKWKRPIAKDDTLALRMIEGRLLSPNYNSFTKYSD